MEIKIKKFSQDAQLPKYGKEGDAAMDLVSNESFILLPGKRYLFSTGIGMEIPNGFFGRVMDRSGMAAKQGITILGGVIDSNYRGEIKICLLNTSDMNQEIEKGDRIAQMAIIPVQTANLTEVNELSNSNRKETGFGASGR